ncbi:MAG: hypothetical protein ACI93R_002484 [Flavobacteriales bacterium]|jgi:hypothetical protein
MPKRQSPVFTGLSRGVEFKAASFVEKAASFVFPPTVYLMSDLK